MARQKREAELKDKCELEKENLKAIIKKYHFIIDSCFDKVIYWEEPDMPTVGNLTSLPELPDSKYEHLGVKKEKSETYPQIFIDKKGSDIRKVSRMWFLESTYKIAKEIYNIQHKKDKWCLMWRAYPIVDYSIDFETMEPIYNVYSKMVIYGEN